MNKKDAWAVRPMPHGVYRIKEFLEKEIAAIGWPAMGDLSGHDREAIRKRLLLAYGSNNSPQSIGQTTGIIDRFVNGIRIGDAVAVPDGQFVYFGTTISEYGFHEEVSSDDKGYPHWKRLKYCFNGKPIKRTDLSANLFSALTGRQTVFKLPSDDVWYIINNQDRFNPKDASQYQTIKSEYIAKLQRGNLPGINSSSFEKAAQRVLSIYFPGLVKLASTNAPIGFDTDLKTTLPSGIVIRVQVKCFQDEWGKLGAEVVRQLRGSMDEGDLGIIITTGSISEDAALEANKDQLKSIRFINGSEFADLVFDNIEKLDDDDLWNLGLRKNLIVR